jgi:hypothetical protein
MDEEALRRGTKAEGNPESRSCECVVDDDAGSSSSPRSNLAKLRLTD